MNRNSVQYLGVLLLCSPFVQAAPSCSGEALIESAFSNGAAWALCWRSEMREHLVLSELFYTPPNDQPRLVLANARVAQLNVAYDDNEVVYNDVTEFGLGGNGAVRIDESDCRGGRPRYQGNEALLCERHHTDSVQAHGHSQRLHGESMDVFAISQVGTYTYVFGWNLHDDGTVEPWVRALGALQRSSENSDNPYGRILSDSDTSHWLNHTHNYYWRLDFDLGDQATDDVVTETRYPLLGDGTRRREVERFRHEQSRTIVAAEFASWQIWDQPGSIPWLQEEPSDLNGFGYRIVPQRYGHKLVRTADDPNTPYDFFLTRARGCERYVNHNASFFPDCADNLVEFANGESVEGEDIVVWYRVSFHHVPRNEDRLTMHAHYDSFKIEPMQLHARTPSLQTLSNQPPELRVPAVLEARRDEPFELALTAVDPEQQPLSFAAMDLPPGLVLDSTGVLRGIPEQAGHFHSRLLVSDGSERSGVELSFKIAEAPQLRTGLSGGALSIWFLFGLWLVVLWPSFRRWPVH